MECLSKVVAGKATDPWAPVEAIEAHEPSVGCVEAKPAPPAEWNVGL
jgi:hypothetical protein